MTTKGEVKTATMDTEELREVLLKFSYLRKMRGKPILSNALVDFSNGKAILTTTDLESAIRVEVPCTNTATFATLLPRKATEKFLTGSNGKVSISSTDKQVTLSREGIGDLRLELPAVSDFLLIPAVPDNLNWQEIDGKWLCSMMGFVALACAQEDSRPVLTGVACSDGAIASANGFRLYVLNDNRLTFGLGSKQAIVPRETISLMIKIFRKEKTLSVAFDDQRVYFKSGNVLMFSQLIQGTFPQYEQLIPDTFNCKVSFSVPLMAQRLGMLDGIVLVSNIMRFVFTTTKHGEQVCLLSGGDEDVGRYNLSCPVKFEGEESKIAFNYKYIQEAIKPFSICNLELIPASSPGKFTGDIEGLTVAIMPMFVQWD